VLLFGTTPGTHGPRGDSLWGRLDVTLRRLASEPGSGFRLAPGADTSTPGSSILTQPSRPIAPKTRESDRPKVPVPSVAPELPQVPPAATAEPAPPHPDESIISEPTPAIPQPAPQLPMPTFDALPHVNLQAPELVDKPIAPPPIAPPIAP